MERHELDGKIQAFAKTVEKQVLAESVKGRHLNAEEIARDGYLDNARTHIQPGRKYIKVDVGKCGRYMIDMEGNIWGVKTYGVIHHAYEYGTVDDIGEWQWGGYHPVKTEEV